MDQSAGGPELLVRLERGAGGVRDQLEDQLRSAVREGRLAAGARLPSTRTLARDLGVSRGLVVDAYAQLAAEGYLVTRQGAPAVVAETVAPGPAAAAEPAAQRAPRFDFRPGAPDVALFPRDRWLRSVRRALAEAPDLRFDYGDPRGAPELRAALAQHLRRVRGLACTERQLIVTSGMAQGFALLARVLAERGETTIAVEEPSSGPGRRQLAAAGLDPVPVAVDGDGLRVDQLPAGAAAALVTPAHQFPTGVVLSPPRRAALAEWAAATGALVLEDDYDAEYRYDRQPVGAVQGLAPDRVVYAGSASKTLAPALRLGWLVVPERLVTAVADAKAADDLGTPIVEQLTFADFLARGELDRHLRRSRAVYRSRRDALVAALARHLPAAAPAGAAAGLHLVLRLPPGADEPALLAAARSAGIGLSGLSEHAQRTQPPALLLGYGRIPEAAIEPGVRRLGEIAGPVLAAGRARQP